MKTQFDITLTLKTSKGLESFAKFFIGNDKARALAIFKQLQGLHVVNENNVLYVDLMETKNGLPVNLDMISCTLNEVTENCRIIIKELFKARNLEGFG